MEAVAKGSFDVKMTPLTWSESAVDHALNRFSLEKTFHGDIEGTSQGQMLSAGTNEKGSAGYVAIEKVTGTLLGRNGSFMMQHNGIMNRGVPQLSIVIVPDSGTGDLTGLAGALTIHIADGKHSYELAYTLATIQ
jgi:hypothetical protein